MNPCSGLKFVVQASACLLWLCIWSLPAAEWHDVQGGRWRQLPVQSSGKPGFHSVSPTSSGVRFTNVCGLDRHLTNQILLNGSGIAAGDVDGDGRCDLYFAGIDSSNALFRNLGNWKFENITDKAGVGCTDLDVTGVALADLDGDVDLDLIVNSIAGGTRIFLNDGTAKFTQTQSVNPKAGGMSLALADIEGDGDLDLYIANYRTVTLRDQPNTRFNIKVIGGKPHVAAVDGRPITHPDLVHRFNFHITMGERGGTFRHEENGEADALYRNEGNGRFSLIPFTNGVFKTEDGKNLALPPFDWGLSVMFRDLNGDHAPDIYVCNDFRSPDRIWINDGRGNFRAVAPLVIRQVSYSSMGVDFADINRDGFDDFIVVDMLSRIHYHRFTQRTDLEPDTTRVGEITNRMQTARNTLFLNRGDGTYAEIGQLSGLEATEWSWTPIFLDIDLDGYEDLLVSNGFERDGMNMDALQEIEKLKKQRSLSSVEQLRLRKMFPRLSTPNLAFRNLGNLKFEDKSAEWGFNESAVSQGMALGDLDNDGDLDVALNNFNGTASLYRNETPAPRVAVKLKGAAENTGGIGAKIKIIGGSVPQTQEMISGGRYLSSDQALRTFAASSGDMTIEVTWRSGQQTTVKGARANRLYEIDETAALPRATVAVSQPKPLFSSARLSPPHRHIDEPFNDFGVQPLLSHRLSQLGPGVSWIDVNADGFDDLLIGSGRGGSLSLHLNDRKGGFAKSDAPPFDEPVPRDQTAVLGWRKPGGELALLAGSANYEQGMTATGGCIQIYDVSAKRRHDSLPGFQSSTGPLALGDIDSDGDLDLFVAGRVLSGRYPEPAGSRLYRNQGGRFDLGMEWPELGLVSGAVFGDLDADGDLDLVLACHWAPLRVFRNTKGQFSDATSELKFDSYTGWWNGVTTGDFDGDGRLDIVASNWGRNTRYESFRGKPLQLFHADLDGNGTVEAVEAYADRHTPEVRPLQPFHLVGAALPLLRERIPTFNQYAESTLPQIYRDGFRSLKQLSVRHLESMVFLNRGDHFEAKPLPIEAQFSPAFATCVADFDGDGNEDIFLSQNFFATHPEISRYDAGRGLLLKGDGRGGFSALTGQESGIVIYGEQRGAAVSDYDHDGRTDLAVTQNGAETVLFRNLQAKPGLRVRLRGPPGNPDAIGATIRIGTPDRLGPAREIHAGSGYWSQDSSTLVLTASSPITKVWVRWPGGKETTSPVPENAREITVDARGSVAVTR